MSRSDDCLVSSLSQHRGYAAMCRVSNIVLTEAKKLRDGWPIIAAGRQIGTKQSSQRQLQVTIPSASLPAPSRIDRREDKDHSCAL